MFYSAPMKDRVQAPTPRPDPDPHPDPDLDRVQTAKPDHAPKPQGPEHE